MLILYEWGLPRAVMSPIFMSPILSHIRLLPRVLFKPDMREQLQILSAASIRSMQRPAAGTNVRQRRVAYHHFPLLRLPVDVLALILVHLTKGRHLRKWIRVAHVCSALRQILCSLEDVWGDAIYSWPNGRHRDEFFERAGATAPLFLLVPDYCGPRDAPQFAKKHLHRARILEVSHDRFLLWFLQNADRLPMPYLEEITLDREVAGAMSAIAYPPRHTPQLHSVTLVNIFWDFCASNVTRLSIYNTTSKRTYSAPQIINLLSECKHLKYLHLSRGLPDFSDELVARATVSLAFLRQLIVSGSRPRAQQLWSLLSVPANADIDFVLESADDGPAMFEDAGLFQRHLSGRRVTALEIDGGKEHLTFTILSTSKPDNGGVETCAARTEPKEESKLELTYMLVESGGFHPLDPTPLPRAVRHVRDALGLAGVAHLRLSQSALHEGDPGCWADALDGFGHVESLRAQDLNSSLCEALGSVSGGSGDPAPLLPLPRLQRLELEETTMYMKTTGVRRTALAARDFWRMLKVRAARGCPLRTIAFCDLAVDRRWSERDQAYGPSSEKGVRRFFEATRAKFPECELEVWEEGRRVEL